MGRIAEHDPSPRFMEVRILEELHYFIGIARMRCGKNCRDPHSRRDERGYLGRALSMQDEQEKQKSKARPAGNLVGSSGAPW
jgi:hypothetical protein